MKNLHGKSSCCREKIIHYGNKRRQCTHCKKTWSVHPRRRGRKRRRCARLLRRQVFSEQRTLTSLACRARITPSGMARRFERLLSCEVRSDDPSCRFRARRYALIVDALWFRFEGIRWTLYLRALKPVAHHKAIFLDPVLLPGKENALDWTRVIADMPDFLKNRIKAFVSDGFRGSKRIVKLYCWIFQRCHFHLIAQLQIRRGRRKTTITGRQTREDIYQTVRKILALKNRSRVKVQKDRLRRLIIRRDCPWKLRSIVREFLRHVNNFRAYLNHPKLNLPNTTNVIESMNSIIGSRCGRLRTPASLARWTHALIKHHSTFICKGANYQQK